MIVDFEMGVTVCRVSEVLWSSNYNLAVACRSEKLEKLTGIKSGRLKRRGVDYSTFSTIF